MLYGLFSGPKCAVNEVTYKHVPYSLTLDLNCVDGPKGSVSLIGFRIVLTRKPSREASSGNHPCSEEVYRYVGYSLEGMPIQL